MGGWSGNGTTGEVPPADYWTHLQPEFDGNQLDALRRASDERVGEIKPTDLPPPAVEAETLLDRVADDGWFRRTERRLCPNCGFVLGPDQYDELLCPNCGEAFSELGGVKIEIVYVRDLRAARSVDWVAAIHGMNTSGAWQEAFTWLLATTWGRSVPVAVYKYGILRVGVVLPWRRQQLKRQLRAKLATLYREAVAQGFNGKADVVAHSFGTWLLGHLLVDELERAPDERLQFGRVILLGSVLRPDYDWQRLRDAGLVDEVMNHYGTRDRVVPFAHPVIFDSGPSGKRGFDGGTVLNVRAEGRGHSDLLTNDLHPAYTDYWRPFLTLPPEELRHGVPDAMDPGEPWRQLPWAFRGTLFPFPALVCIAAGVALVIAGVGRGLWEAWVVFLVALAAGAASLLALATGMATALALRRLRR